ncbi:MAG TPA: ECF transporter S component [Spirochaetes bacterium]|nr:ECF transporter S component [Spirochaetota bacterium]
MTTEEKVDLNKVEVPASVRKTFTTLIVPVGIAVNVLGSVLSSYLKLPLFLDSIGTAVIAAIMGPWIGVVTGIFTNVFMAVVHGDVRAIPFGMCNAATGLIVGLMVKYGLFKNVFWVLVTAVFVALANSMIAAPIATFLFGGVTGAGVDLIVGAFLAAGKNILSATFWARMPVNLLDKGVAVVVAFIVLKSLPETLKSVTLKKNADQ